MAKSLKEALLEKFADLQQLGIAPTTAPPMDDDRPAVVVEMGPDSYGTGGGRRQRMNRGGGYDDDSGRGGDVPIRPRGGRRGAGGGGGGGRGGERGERGRGGPPQAGERFRRPDRGGDRAALEGLPAPMPPGGGPRPGPRPPFGDRGPGGPGGPRPPFGDRGPGGPRPPFGDRGPGGPRPPFGDRGPGGPGGPRPPMRPGGPGGPGGPPQMGTTERLQRNAELKRREEGMREQLQGLLNTVGGLEVTPEVYDKWLADLTVETGALPPIDRVVEAIQLANSIEAAKVGNAVRQLFRRPRPRPAGPGPAGAAPARPAAQAAPAPAPAQAAPAPEPAPEPEPAASN